MAAKPAGAAVVSLTVDQPLSATPDLVTYDGMGIFSFTASPTGYGPGAAVATTGAGEVTTFFGSVTDFTAGSSIDQTGELYTFASYPTPATIPDSAADDFIGLSVPLADGTHYGYAEVDGSELVSVGFEDLPATSILTGATGTTSTGISAGVPEPAATLLLGGLGVLVSTVRSHRRR